MSVKKIAGSRDEAITELLWDWSRGDRQALNELMPLVAGELRRLAARHLQRERPGHTLQPTALVHEVYLRLADQEHVQWQGRLQFFAFAAKLMRRILVDHARAERASKRGSGRTVMSLDEAMGSSEPPSHGQIDVLDLDDALKALGALDVVQGCIVELRFFAGLSLAEIAEFLDLSEATVNRRWASARAWLYRRLRGHRDRRIDAKEICRE